ncbi:glycosyltransferase [Loktanella sp. F6476L]|uniref:glycosyltransferase family 2 protein n=1 Tax=Loktanella sp. F6476L TaxID=2926405 RepID=UPI001FF4B9BA|nr:glycosyltransferase family 2 protein [Loktanella sp. F6476L]MCK0122133.1 glycosyltransferase [Loktanella sp. F6476L]
MPTVSILMPAYNASTTIGSAIASVQSQTETDWTLHVIDDLSDDDTFSIVNALAMKDPRIQLSRNPGPRGAAYARNHGLDQAQGRYIAFLDADDLWKPSKLTRQIALLRQTGAVLSYCGFTRRRHGHPDTHVQVPEILDYETLLRGNIIGCLTAIYDTERCGKIPMPLIHRRHDFALWLTILNHHGPAYGINEPLAVLRMSATSLSANKVKATYGTWRMYRDIIGLSIMASTANLCRHLFQRVFR